MPDSFLEKQNYLETYQKELLPFYKLQEARRLIDSTKSFFARVVSIFLFSSSPVAIFMTFDWITTSLSKFSYIACFLLFIFLGFLYYLAINIWQYSRKLEKDFSNCIKDHCINKLLTKIHSVKKITTKNCSKEELQIYNEIDKKTFEAIDQCFLLNGYSDDIEDDIYVFSSKSIKCYMTEMILKETLTLHHSDIEINKFKGVVACFELSKVLISDTIISSGTNKILLALNGYVLVKKLNKHFNLYAKNKFNYENKLSTDEILTLLENIRKSFKSKKINLFMNKNKILIAINTNKDILEIANLYKNYKDSQCIVNFYNEINAIRNLVEYFNKSF